MARVTAAGVELIFSTTLTDAQLDAFINTATILVDVVAQNAADCDPDLSASELVEIERWLAAHFASIRDPVSLRSKIGDAEAWHFPAAVTTAWGKALNLTPYGQMAVALDRTGTLANLGKQRASFRAAPRENSENFTDGLT